MSSLNSRLPELHSETLFQSMNEVGAAEERHPVVTLCTIQGQNHQTQRNKNGPFQTPDPQFSPRTSFVYLGEGAGVHSHPSRNIICFYGMLLPLNTSIPYLLPMLLFFLIMKIFKYTQRERLFNEVPCFHSSTSVFTKRWPLPLSGLF